MPSTGNMDPPVEPQPTRSRRVERERERERANNSGAPATPPTYGYHNTFHTHATPVLTAAPSYACATSPPVLARQAAKASEEAAVVRQFPEPPPYTCTIGFEGILGMKGELTSVFQIARNREWHDVYAVLRGTQLCLHRVKMPGILSKSKAPLPGRLVKTFTLQHAEVGIASDFKKTSLTPKSPFAHLIPVSSRAKLYETDPHLFESPREHVLRLRLETEQFLLCASTQEDMLRWSENLCAAIDISPPLEDRSEPRYRSLPRRSRRQRVLDGARFGEEIENLSTLEIGRRIIAEQEEIIRQLYPHLANSGQQPDAQEPQPAQSGDLDRDEFDADDVRFPTGSAQGSRAVSPNGEIQEESQPLSSEAEITDPKTAPIVRPSDAQSLRYRRRCAPVLLACSPRVSDVVFKDGQRLRINTKETILVSYTSHPPRYDSHNYPKVKRSQKPIRIAPQPEPAPIALNIERPSSPSRGVSDDSMRSFGYDLASTSSTDRIQSATPSPSEPPSPTALTQAKADANRQLSAMGKRSDSEERPENNIAPMTLDMPCLI